MKPPWDSAGETTPRLCSHSFWTDPNTPAGSLPTMSLTCTKHVGQTLPAMMDRPHSKVGGTYGSLKLLEHCKPLPSPKSARTVILTNNSQPHHAGSRAKVTSLGNNTSSPDVKQRLWPDSKGFPSPAAASCSQGQQGAHFSLTGCSVTYLSPWHTLGPPPMFTDGRMKD